MWLPLLFNFNLQKPYRTVPCRTVPFRPVLIVLIKNKEPCTRFSIGQTKEGVRNIKSFDEFLKVSMCILKEFDDNLKTGFIRI